MTVKRIYNDTKSIDFSSIGARYDVEIKMVIQVKVMLDLLSIE